MGCCFSQAPESEGNLANSRTPLLSGAVSKQPRSTGTGTGIANSARHYKPTATDEEEGIPTLSCRPVNVRAVDKRIQDHMQLYNDHVERFERLQETVVSLREMFSTETNSDLTLIGCFKHLRQITDDSIRVTRNYQYCMELEFDDPKTLPQSVHSAVVLFNAANKLTKELLDKSAGIVSSVELVIQSERDLRREVLVASLGQDGPQSMKNCLDNVADLKQVSGFVDDIKRKTLKDFDDLKIAAQYLLEQGNENVQQSFS